MRIIVSDVTYMSAEICVAGWCSQDARMVRPLSAVGQHWRTDSARPGLFAMGNELEITPAKIRNNRGLPHSKEDVIVGSAPRLIRSIRPDRIAVSLSQSESPSVAALFAGHIHDGKYVMADSDCVSLGAVRVQRDSIQFNERQRDRGPQLRCKFRDATRAPFDLPIVAVETRDFWSQSDLDAVNKKFRGEGALHMRIGLAHPFADKKCYAMINGFALY